MRFSALGLKLTGILHGWGGRRVLGMHSLAKANREISKSMRPYLSELHEGARFWR